MNIQDFWRLIDASATASGGGCAAQAAYLRDALQQRGRADCLTFYQHLREQMAALHSFDVLAADFLVQHSVTPDVFREFRAWLVCRGRTTFEKVRKDVAAIADFLDARQVDYLDGKILLIAAEEAYDALGGSEDEFYARVEAVNEPPFELLWPQSWEDVSTRWPALYKKFGQQHA